MKLEQDRRRCERSFIAFAKAAFPIVEPDCELTVNIPVDCITTHLEAAVTGGLRAQVINLPPGALKSNLLVLFSAWLFARDPSTKIIRASYKTDLAVRDNMKVRRVLESQWFLDRWPGVRLREDANTKVSFETTASGHSVVVPVNSSTGYRCTVMLIDDPADITAGDGELAAIADWYFSVMSSRINDPGTGIKVVIGQRVHVNDLSGEIIRRGLNYTHVCLPMEFDRSKGCKTPAWQDPRKRDGDLLMPERVDEREVAQLRQMMGSWRYSAIYQQAPTSIEGSLFKRAWFNERHLGLRGWPRRRTFQDPSVSLVGLPELSRGIVFTSTDPVWRASETSDFCAITTWLFLDKLYLLGVVHARMNLSDTCKALMDINRQYQIAANFIEATGNSKEIVAMIGAYCRGMIPVTPKGQKYQRALAVAPACEAGNIVLPAADVCEWVESPFLEQVLSFDGRQPHDDIVDSFTQAVSQCAVRFGMNGEFCGERAEICFFPR